MLIVDVGSKGGVVPILKNALDETRFIAFEPLESSESGDLKEGNFKWGGEGAKEILSNTLVWNKKTNLSFHVCRKREVSSVFLPNVEFISNFLNPERFDIEDTLTLKADKLDNLISEDIDYIKVDAQGASFEILEGAYLHLMNNSPMLEVELEFEPIYKNQKLFEKTTTMLRDLNYSIIHMELNHWANSLKHFQNSHLGSTLVWAQVFFAVDPSVLKAKNVNLDGRRKIAKALKFDSYADKFSY
jgi:FkbM family methyltransferase